MFDMDDDVWKYSYFLLESGTLNSIYTLPNLWPALGSRLLGDVDSLVLSERVYLDLEGLRFPITIHC